MFSAVFSQFGNKVFCEICCSESVCLSPPVTSPRPGSAFWRPSQKILMAQLSAKGLFIPHFWNTAFKAYKCTFHCLIHERRARSAVLEGLPVGTVVEEFQEKTLMFSFCIMWWGFSWWQKQCPRAAEFGDLLALPECLCRGDSAQALLAAGYSLCLAALRDTTVWETEFPGLERGIQQEHLLLLFTPTPVSPSLSWARLEKQCHRGTDTSLHSADV